MWLPVVKPAKAVVMIYANPVVLLVGFCGVSSSYLIDDFSPDGPRRHTNDVLEPATEQAPRGAPSRLRRPPKPIRDFAQGAAKKFVFNPHGLIKS